MRILQFFKQKTTKQQRLFLAILICLVIGSIIWVQHNYSFYKSSIAEVIEITSNSSTKVEDNYENKDILYHQELIAEVKNGAEKGEHIYLTNDYSMSQGFDQKFKIGSEVFVTINAVQGEQQILNGTITGVKRDKYLVTVLWVFIFILLAVGKRQGFLSVISLAFNATLLWFALDLYIKYGNQSLLWICGFSIVIFTIFSLLLVNGRNKKHLQQLLLHY